VTQAEPSSGSWTTWASSLLLIGDPGPSTSGKRTRSTRNGSEAIPRAAGNCHSRALAQQFPTDPRSGIVERVTAFALNERVSIVRHDADPARVVVVLPGLHHSIDFPALHFAYKILVAKGWSVMRVRWSAPDDAANDEEQTSNFPTESPLLSATSAASRTPAFVSSFASCCSHRTSSAVNRPEP